VSLLADTATNKLAEVFRTMFKTTGKEREGKLTADNAPGEEPK
jgi:hypothetical protein